ncbi:MAG: recombination protein RecR, partial [Planctomycetaceae bacterium]|nr:recombination protein RecR [Planctomycetaceae bacterium]
MGRLVHQFALLPGIGRKTADRLANHVLSCSNAEAMALAEAIREVKQSIRRCRVCFNLTDQELCSICSNPRRDRKVVCVVEQPKDVNSLEATS